MSKLGANIYTVEGVIMSAVGVAWCEIFAMVTGAASPINAFAFYVLAVAGLVNIFLCTIMDACKVQQVFMSLVMGIAATYIWVAANILAAQSIRDSPYAQYFMGASSLKDLFPVVGISISLSLLVVQTLIAAAAVSPNLWDNPVTGPTVVAAVLLASKDKTCGLVYILIFVFVSICEVVTYPKQQLDTAPKVQWTPFIILCVALGAQVAVGGLSVFFLLSRVVMDIDNSPVLVTECVLFGIPVLASIIRCIKTAVQVFKASRKLEQNQEVPLAANVPVSTERAQMTMPGKFPHMQTAFYTTEASLFRATPLTSQWAPKKSI